MGLGHSRRYSPFNRAHGLRRLPDEMVGLAFLASLILHVALVMSLVHITHALPERPGGADVPTVLMDLAAVTPSDPPALVPAAIASGERAAAARSAMTSAPSAGPERGASRSELVAMPAVQSSVPPVEAPEPAQQRPVLVSAVSASANGPGVTAPSDLDIDVPLDASWPEPPLMTMASPPTAQPAKTLTAAPSIRDWVQGVPGMAPPTLLVQDVAQTAVELRESAAARKPFVPAPVAPAPAPAQPRSSFGLNRERALVRLDGPRAWVADDPTQTVSGTILGGLPERLMVYVNGVPAEVTTTGRTFETAALLRPGANELRAVVTSQGGLEAEDTITVQYVARPSLSGIALTSPPDGLTLGPHDPPVAVVEGQVDDQSLTTIWIVANDRRIPVTASAGKFRHTVLLTDPLVHLRAEASGGDVVRRSGTVTIRTAGAPPASGVLVMPWPAGTDGSSVEVSATWRAQSERLDSVVQTMRLPAVEETTNGAASAMFYLRALKPGVYTLIVRYRGTASLEDVRPTLYLPDKDHLAPRSLRPVSLPGAGRRVVAKVLMPQGILWNQEEWFSGTSESVDTVTKFRVPEGISWVERKADLQ